MSRKVCIAGGAATPFDYPMHITTEAMAANCIVETQHDIPDFTLRDLQFMVYSHFSVHFGKQLCPESDLDSSISPGLDCARSPWVSRTASLAN